MLPREIETAIRVAASERHCDVGVDTHFDADNCEVVWWRGARRHRLDFQSTGCDTLTITLFDDEFPSVLPFLPRLLVWARQWIPMFPYLATTTWRTLGEFRYGEVTLEMIRDTLDKAKQDAKTAG